MIHESLTWQLSRGFAYSDAGWVRAPSTRALGSGNGESEPVEYLGGGILLETVGMGWFGFCGYCHRSALGMERDCQHGLYKAGMGSSRVLSDFAEKYGSKNRVLAGFGIGGKSGKEKVYKLGCDRERLKMN
ncbi:hypothetical protein Tco_0415280 [Tanacetum coccineum]